MHGLGYCCCCGACRWKTNDWSVPFTVQTLAGGGASTLVSRAEVVEDDGTTLNCCRRVVSNRRPCLEFENHAEYSSLYDPPAVTSWSAQSATLVWFDHQDWRWTPDGLDHRWAVKIDQSLRYGRTVAYNGETVADVEDDPLQAYALGGFLPGIVVQQGDDQFVQFVGTGSGLSGLDGQSRPFPFSTSLSPMGTWGRYVSPKGVGYHCYNKMGGWTGPGTSWLKIRIVDGHTSGLALGAPTNDPDDGDWQIGLMMWVAASQQQGVHGTLPFLEMRFVQRVDNLCIMLDPADYDD